VARKKTDPGLELKEVFRLDAAELTTSREKSIVVHRTDNVRAAGDEVEHATRIVLARKLQQSCKVGHGHIVDQHGSVSGQLDVIISAAPDFPSLFDCGGGAKYFPYESVYAIGEIKSSFSASKKPVHNFVKSLKEIKKDLKREAVAESFIHTGRGWGIELQNLPPIQPVNHPLNPLFAFMIFVASKGFKMSHLEELYESEHISYLPNLICFLDRGVLAYSESSTDRAMTHVYPEYASTSPNWWTLRRLAKVGDANCAGGNFALLWSILTDHLRTCVLKSAPSANYLRSWLTYNDDQEEFF
jgi:hypothetical protein